jgi:hypothetical protein
MICRVQTRHISVNTCLKSSRLFGLWAQHSTLYFSFKYIKFIHCCRMKIVSQLLTITEWKLSHNYLPSQNENCLTTTYHHRMKIVSQLLTITESWVILYAHHAWATHWYWSVHVHIYTYCDLPLISISLYIDLVYFLKIYFTQMICTYHHRIMSHLGI